MSNLPRLTEILNDAENVKVLKSQMYDTVMTSRRSLLSHATTFGGLEAIELMDAKLQPDWNTPDGKGRIPSWSHKHWHYFISKGRVDYSARDGAGGTIFHQAVEADDLETTRLMLSKIGSEKEVKDVLNALNSGNESSLYHARSLEMRKLLMDKGADPTKGRPILQTLVGAAKTIEHNAFLAKQDYERDRQSEGATQPYQEPAHFAQQRADNLESARLFLDAGVSPTEPDVWSETSFYGLAKKAWFPGIENSEMHKYVELSLSSPHFDWKRELFRSGVEVLKSLPQYLNRRTGILAERESELCAYSHVPNYLDLAQIGLDVDCAICLSTAGTTGLGESGESVTGIVAHACGKLLCNSCHTEYTTQKIANGHYPDCPSCRGTQDFIRLAPQFTSSKDKRLQRLPQSHSSDEASEPASKKARIAE